MTKNLLTVSEAAPLVPAQGVANTQSAAVTVDRIERDIHIVADVMVKHKRRGLIDTIRILEAERDRLRNETDPLEYAKQILSKNA